MTAICRFRRRISGLTKPTARRVNLQHIASLHFCAADMAELFYAAVFSHNAIKAYCAWLAAIHAEGGMDASVA
jgi:hypothetical protein